MAALSHAVDSTWGACKTLLDVWMARRPAGETGCACRNLPSKFGDKLSEEQLQQIEELGLLADIDDQVCLTGRRVLLLCPSACDS